MPVRIGSLILLFVALNSTARAQEHCSNGCELTDPGPLTKALAARPHDAHLLACLGEVYRRRGNDPAAMDFYRKAVVADGRNIDAWLGITTLLRSALEKDPSNEALRLQLIEATLHSGRTADLDGEITLLLESEPPQEEKLKLTATLITAGQLDRAQTILDGLAKAEPVPEEVSFQSGLILMEKGDYESAVMNLGHAAQAEPGESKYSLALADALLRWHHYTTAKAFLQAVEKNFGSIAEFQYDLAYTYYGTHDMQRAVTILSSLIKEHPRYSPALFLLGECYGAMGDLTRGKQFLSDAITADGTKPLYYESLVEVERHQGNCVDSLAMAKKGLALDPDNAELILASALCHEKMGEFASAQHLLERLVQLQPNNLTAHRVLARIYSRTGNKAAAIAESRKLQQLADTPPTINSTKSK